MENKTDIWQVQGNLVFKLKHAGWRKGVELFENESTISVNTRADGALGKVLAQSIAELLNKNKVLLDVD